MLPCRPRSKPKALGWAEKLMCWLGDKGRQACPQKRKKAIKVWNVWEIKQAGWNMQNKVERPAKSGNEQQNRIRTRRDERREARAQSINQSIKLHVTM